MLKEQHTNPNHASSSSQPREIAQPKYIDTNPCEITNGDSAAPALYTDKRKEKKKTFHCSPFLTLSPMKEGIVKTEYLLNTAETSSLSSGFSLAGILYKINTVRTGRHCLAATTPSLIPLEL